MPSKGNKCCCGGSSSPSHSPSHSPSASPSPSPEDPVPASPCCQDSIQAAEYSFTMSGSTNVPASGCTSCSAVNGSFTVTYNSFGDFRSPEFASCPYFFGETGYEWRLSFQCIDTALPIGNDTMRVTLICQPMHGPGPAMVVYRTDFPIPLDCLSSMTLNKLTEPGVNCTGYPATVTVNPV